MIYTILGLMSIAFAGRQRALFECIILFDSLKNKLGTIYGDDSWWSFHSFCEQKDRNLDGKASWMEKTFPDDGGHRVKNAEIFFLLVGGIGLYDTIPALAIFYVIGGFAVYGFSFDITFNKYRK
jgi:hypothetical protein